MSHNYCYVPSLLLCPITIAMSHNYCCPITIAMSHHYCYVPSLLQVCGDFDDSSDVTEVVVKEAERTRLISE